MILTDTCLGKGKHCWHIQLKSPVWPDTPGLGPSGSPTPHGLGLGSRTRGPAEGLQGFGDLGPPGSPMQKVLGSRHTIFGWNCGPDTSPGFRSQAPTARRPLSMVFPSWGWAHPRREWWILHPNLLGPCHTLFYPPGVGMAPGVSPALASPLHLRGWLLHFSASLGMWPHFQTPLWGVQLSYCKALIPPSFVSPFRWPWILVPQPWRQLRTLVMKTTLILVTCFSPEQRELVSLWNTRVDDRDHGLSPSGHPWGRHNLSRTSWNVTPQLDRTQQEFLMSQGLSKAASPHVLTEAPVFSYSPQARWLVHSWLS